ncbi:hypothetical protein [Gloeobacter morelensis]|uniref:Uncharacterized protein n=1 Tax=Gloeobacter morelensis MG652769 TaxID=2781736 RepID=A0ABY3PML1_9CYAN|nr:hypothetical protein [Gloeobacter morelensis]UFP94881.1 hypothetical protein ISF26_01125 [Gloeobacter morelensis MG652769]
MYPIERVRLYPKDRLVWKAFEILGDLETKVGEQLQRLDAATILSLTAYPFLIDTLLRSLCCTEEQGACAEMALALWKVADLPAVY